MEEGNSSLKFWFDKIRKELLCVYVENEANKLAQILLEDLLSISKSTIATSPDFELSSTQIQQIEEALKRLLQHEPVQYVTGISEFANRQFEVNNHVLIPRPETEELLIWILDDFKTNTVQSIQCIDIGTGSGIIPITLKLSKPEWEIYAMDISNEALQVARTNASKYQANIKFIDNDILSPKHDYELYDIIVSNPPYVTEEDKNLMQKNVLDFEPHIALFVNNGDPLQFYKAIIQFAKKHLKSEGFIYCELHEDYAEQSKILFEKYYNTVELKKDINGKRRMLKAGR